MRAEHAEWIAAFLARQSNGSAFAKCAEATQEMVAAFPDLRRVAGFAHTDWGQRTHWWCVAPDGSVVDPTVSQFPFGLVYEYEELDLADPATVDRVPTGVCYNCGAPTFRGETCCSEACERAAVASLNAGGF